YLVGWIPPCREDHKKIKLMSKSLKDKKVEVIGLSTDENIAEWQRYLRNNEYDWTNYAVPETNMLLNDLKISSYPSYFLIDRNYNFIGVFANIDQFQYDFLDKLK
ncbi:TlpA family protein disulfide reductase, partial [Sphingobacterium sp. UBA3549]